jgi:hypothetical protein
MQSEKTQMIVSNVKFVEAGVSEKTTGLLGYLSFELDGLIGVDGVTLRRTLDGRRVLSFPVRRDGRGVNHALLRPLSHRATRIIESQVFRALGMGGAND